MGNDLLAQLAMLNINWLIQQYLVKAVGLSLVLKLLLHSGAPM